MKRISLAFVAALLMASAGWSANGLLIKQSDCKPGVLIVTLKQDMRGKFVPPTKTDNRSSFGITSLDGVCQMLNVSKVEPLFYDPNISKNEKAVKHGLDLMFIVRFPATTDINYALKQFRGDRSVRCCSPDMIRKLDYTPNDPMQGSQWGITKIQAPLAWDITQGDTTTLIGVVDSGCDWTHEDLEGNSYINQAEDINHNGVFDNYPSGSGGDRDSIDNDGNGLADDVVGWDFADNDPDPYPTGDPQSHGTHCNGIAGATTDNGIGIAGTGFKCRRIAFRCVYQGGIGIAAALNSMYYAVEKRASVISNSWGSYYNDENELIVLDYVHDNGLVVTCAAGNDDVRDYHYPSYYPNMLAVAASGNNDVRASWSNHGTWVNVIAPGVTILSTLPGNAYQSTDWSGTSMACPFVAGVAALLRSSIAGRDWSNTTIEGQIKNYGADVDALNPGYAGLIGRRLDAYGSLTGTPVPQLEYADYTFTETSGDGDGRIEAGETIGLKVYVKNAWGNAHNIIGTLSTGDPFITVTSGSSTYGSPEGNFLGGHTRSNNQLFTISIASDAPYHMVPMTIHLSGDGYDVTLTFHLNLGRSGILFVNHGEMSAGFSYDPDTGENEWGERFLNYLYAGVLDSLGYSYDTWKWARQETPPVWKLKTYGTVLWCSEWTFPSLISTDIDALMEYMDNGGSFYISGQDIGYEADAYAGVLLDFYRNYMKADYGNDQGSSMSMTGIPGDPIGDGLSFDFYQPYFTPDMQYPDYFTPRGTATSVFNYTGGSQVGAIKYVGTYRLFYIADGLEAVGATSMTPLAYHPTRNELGKRILRWLNGNINIEHTSQVDTEDTTAAIPISALITGDNALSTARTALYWMAKSEGIYHSVPFTVSGDTFTAEIPALNRSDSIFYFIYAEDASGYANSSPINGPSHCHTFYLGTDLVPPVLTATANPDTMELIGPYNVAVNVTDNFGVDTNSAQVHFYREGMPEPEDSVAMAYLGDGNFGGTFQPPSWSRLNQHLYYYFTARDAASSHNNGNSALQSFKMKDSLYFDSFPSTIINYAAWDTGVGWCGTTGGTNPNQPGVKSQRSSYYTPNFENSFTRTIPYNFCPYTGMELHFRHRRYLANGDTGHVELTRDGITWESLGKYAGAVGWTTTIVPIPASYCSTENDNDSIMIRFRFKSNAAADTNFGWYLDDIRLKATGPYYVGIEGERPLETIPTTMELRPAYPNPTFGLATIDFQLPAKQRVALDIYNILGQKVRRLINSSLPAGKHQAIWDGRDEQGRAVTNGIYFYRLDAGQTKLTNKLVIIR